MRVTTLAAASLVLLSPLVPVSEAETVLVISADTENCLLATGGTIAGMAEKGAEVYVVRVGNDEKDSWRLSAEDAAFRTLQESEAAARALGVKQVISLGYRSAELADVPFTTLRDRLMVLIRKYRPSVLFLPNPYTEYDRVLDRYYTGRAAEDAWRAASLENYLPAFAGSNLRPHLTPEAYYYAQPVDPRRRDPESTAVFVPQPKTVDISATIEKKVKAAQALRTVNYAAAMRLKARLAATGRRLPLLDTVDGTSVDRLVEENVRGLAKTASVGSSYALAEEFRYAGAAYRIPSKYLR